MRLDGGVKVLASCLLRITAAPPLSDAQRELAACLMRLTAALAGGNAANKLCMREAGIDVCLVALMDEVLAPAASRQEAAQASAHAQAGATTSVPQALATDWLG